MNLLKLEINFEQPIISRPKASSKPLYPWKHIFSYLSNHDLIHYSRVCAYWCKIANELLAFRMLKLPQNVVEDFAPVVENKVLKWNAVQTYSFLSHFFREIVENSLCANSHARQDNSEDYYRDDLHHLRYRKSFVSYGRFYFSIWNETDIMIEDTESEKLWILRGEKNRPVTHLVVENETLFCLRKDGMIIQWDYRNEKITGKIETLYSQQKSGKKYILRIYGSLCGENAFYVKDGIIVIKYATAKICEILFLKEQRRLKVQMNFDSPPTIQIFDKMIFLYNKQRILIYDLEKAQIIKNLKIHKSDITLKFLYVAFHDKLFYVYSSQKKTHIYNAQINRISSHSFKYLQHFYEPHARNKQNSETTFHWGIASPPYLKVIHPIVAIASYRNLFFVCHKIVSTDPVVIFISVIDLNTGKGTTIHNFIDLKNRNIKLFAYETLINYCENLTSDLIFHPAYCRTKNYPY